MRVNKIFGIIDNVYKEYTKSVADNEVADLFRECYSRKYPPRAKKQQPVVVMGGKQLKTAPPLFYAKTSKNAGLPKSYKNYLRNNIRRKYGFEGSPINIICRDNKAKHEEDFE